MKTKQEIINKTLDRIFKLFEEEFHDHRSEIQMIISTALKYQDRNTRHKCAEATIGCNLNDVHNVIMNCNKGLK